MRTVGTLDEPGLAPYRTLRRQEEHRVQGIFVAEGEKVVRRLLASDLPVVSLLLSPPWAERLSEENMPAGTEVFVADDALLRTITGYRLHQGIMAVGRIPPEPTMEELLRQIDRPRLFVALDGIAHAENVGVIVRTCGAFGVQGILAGSGACSPWVRRAVRNSMGAVFRVPVIHSLDLPGALRSLQNHHGILVAVTDAHTGRMVHRCDLTGDLCVVFGEEESGVSAEVAALAALTVRIPMAEGIDSLNVGSAAAAALYEVRRQRPGMG